MRRVTCLVALAAVVALALPSGGRATVMQAARPVPDFNNDGFGDLAVGAPGENVGRRRSDAGAISVLYGRANGMRSNRRWITQNTPACPGSRRRATSSGPLWSPAGSTATASGTWPSAPRGGRRAAAVTPGRSPSCTAPTAA